MKTKLVNIAKKMSSDFKDNNQEFDALIDEHMESSEDGFEKLYNSVLELKSKFEAEFNKLYPYLYFHYM